MHVFSVEGHLFACFIFFSCYRIIISINISSWIHSMKHSLGWSLCFSPSLPVTLYHALHHYLLKSILTSRTFSRNTGNSIPRCMRRTLIITNVCWWTQNKAVYISWRIMTYLLTPNVGKHEVFHNCNCTSCLITWRINCGFHVATCSKNRGLDFPKQKSLGLKQRRKEAVQEESKEHETVKCFHTIMVKTKYSWSDWLHQWIYFNFFQLPKDG